MNTVSEPVVYQNHTVNNYSIDQSTYVPAQTLATAPGQTNVVEQNQTVILQQDDTQNMMLAQAQLAMVQQRVTDQMIMQQQVDTQNMMLAQTQMAVSQQTPGGQTVYVDQGQYDVTYVQDTNTTVYDGATETVALTDASAYEQGYVVEGLAGEELVYAEQDPVTGEYYEVEYEVDATGDTGDVYETEVVEQEIDATGDVYEAEAVEQDYEVCY